MTTSSQPTSSQPWLRPEGSVIQEFGIVKQLPVALSYDARRDSFRRLDKVLSRLLEAHETILTKAHDAVARTGERQAWFPAGHLVDTLLVRA
ncbi:hypothetical protein ACFZAR_19120 [Streptomyces sp. NPDC008222]|uniref:hypothetical protein n=1 Tax=Streptomyces sp. NPDC008222 TaxID=3364820 RepID=UPI0036EA5A2F